MFTEIMVTLMKLVGVTSFLITVIASAVALKDNM